MRLSSRSVAAAVLTCGLLLGVAAPAWSQTTWTVSQIGFSFSPDTLDIDVGDTVEWVWSSGSHTVTEGTGPIPVGGEAFNEPLNSASTVVSVTFDTAFLFANPRVDNRYDYYCIPHFSLDQTGVVNVTSPWVDLGCALGGTNGDPLLVGNGTLESGTTMELELSNALPNTLVGLFVSLFDTPTPFKGGVLKPVPFFIPPLFFPIGASGGVTLSDTVLPSYSGLTVYWQYAVEDAGAPVGVALSNAICSVFP